MISRRTMLLASLTPLATSVMRTGGMTLSIHQNTSSGAGYRKSLEGWARAGIKNVEITAQLLDDFLKNDSLSSASRVITDNGLTPVSCACGVNGLWEPNPNHATAIENLKKRCEQLATLGLGKFYAPVTATTKFTEDDIYRTGAENMRSVGDVAKQFNMTAMAEFTRASTFIATLGTMIRVTRAAAHPNMKILFDCYHFWSGQSKFEDLDLVKTGDIGHVHFQDVPDMPRELLDQTTRLIPGDGVTPLVKILRKLADKGYAGPLSVELFLPKFQQGDPYEIAREIRRKGEGVMRQARVA
jgi:2-keto-myo-inositol isomerase